MEWTAFSSSIVPEAAPKCAAGLTETGCDGMQGLSAEETRNKIIARVEKVLKGGESQGMFKVALYTPSGTAIPVVMYIQMLDMQPTLIVDCAESKANIHTFPLNYIRKIGQLDGVFEIETGRRCHGGGGITHRYLVGKNDVSAAVKRLTAQCQNRTGYVPTTPLQTPGSTLEKQNRAPTAGFAAVLHLKIIDNKPTLIVDDSDTKKNIHTLPIEYLRGYGQKDGKLKLHTGRRCPGGPAVHRYEVGKNDIATAMKQFVADWKASCEKEELDSGLGTPERYKRL